MTEAGEDYDIDAALHQLHNSLANEEGLIKRSRGSSRWPELLLLHSRGLRLKMDPNKNHGRAHIHLDYGRVLHQASYAVDTGERLAGEESRFDRKIMKWIILNREELLKIWSELRNSRGQGEAEVLVRHLKGDIDD